MVATVAALHEHHLITMHHPFCTLQNEFVDYFNTLTRKMTHNTFDLMLYRFSRCIEEVCCVFGTEVCRCRRALLCGMGIV